MPSSKPPPRGWDGLPEQIKSVLRMLGPSGRVHIETRPINSGTIVGGSFTAWKVTPPTPPILMTMVAEYTSPVLSLRLEAEAETLDDLCSQITFQFLHEIRLQEGMNE